jgi:hypothetical protein
MLPNVVSKADSPKRNPIHLADYGANDDDACPLSRRINDWGLRERYLARRPHAKAHRAELVGGVVALAPKRSPCDDASPPDDRRGGSEPIVRCALRDGGRRRARLAAGVIELMVFF